MAERTFGEEFGSEVAKKVIGQATLWGPGLASLFLLGPMGLLLAFAASVAIADNLPSGGEQPKD